jgi:hypothetical protein
MPKEIAALFQDVGRSRALLRSEFWFGRHKDDALPIFKIDPNDKDDWEPHEWTAAHLMPAFQGDNLFPGHTQHERSLRVDENRIVKPTECHIGGIGLRGRVMVRWILNPLEPRLEIKIGVPEFKAAASPMRENPIVSIPFSALGAAHTENGWEAKLDLLPSFIIESTSTRGAETWGYIQDKRPALATTNGEAIDCAFTLAEPSCNIVRHIHPESECILDTAKLLIKNDRNPWLGWYDATYRPVSEHESMSHQLFFLPNS